MIDINPLSGALLQSTQLQLAQASDKSKQARKAQEMAKNVAARDDELEHQVENSEELTAVHEQGRGSDDRRKRKQAAQEQDENGDEDGEGLDLTA